ncbi:hypothetical protein GW17_00034548 [Ensete ventricosum]|nr:hypothetical protein GW17_00034548 [Ensete ventricosum]
MTGAMELQPDDGPRSSLSIGLGFRRCSGISPKFARRFTEGIRKLTGNMLRDCQKKTIGLVARISEAAGLVGGLVFTHRRSTVDVSVPQGGGLGSGREDEVGGDEDKDAQEEERPRDYYVPSIGLVNTHSHEEGLKALELIINTGEAMCV